MTDDAAAFAAQEAEAAAYLSRKWTQSHRCPICGSDSWSVSSYGEIHHLQRTGDAVFGGEANVFPVFFAACMVCGYMHLFNVVVAGIGPMTVEQMNAQREVEAAAQPAPSVEDHGEGTKP